MNKKIHFGEPYTPHLPKEKLPFAQQLVRSTVPVPQQRKFQIYILREAWEQIMRHLNDNVNVECGGVLVGHPFRNLDDPDMTFVVITEAIAQNTSNHSVAHFTVGPKEIEITRNEMQKRCPGLVCVGWYHSHPGHGVFLSGQDMQIVRSIYDAEWHLALVVDPKRSEAAFFRGPEGERFHDWTEISAIPQTVRAISWYNQAREAAENGDPRKLERLKQWLLNIPELSHWHSLGKYQDLELEPLVSSKSVYDDVEPFMLEAGGTFANSRAETTLRNEEQPSQEIEQLEYKYSMAVGLYQKGSYASALGLFNEIKEILPDYRDVDIYIEKIKNEDKDRNRGRLKY